MPAMERISSPSPNGAEILSSLAAHSGARWRSWLTASFSILLHGLVLGTIVIIPILLPVDYPERPDLARVIIYNPPPPPPPPPLRGNPMSTRSPDPELESAMLRERPPMTIPADLVSPPDLSRELSTELEQLGSLAGSEFGSPDGMEEGVVGGVVGGVPGGVIGGVIGGTGDGIVQDYDREPRLIRRTPPTYPKEAFIKKIEGVVVLEIVIDTRGRVLQPRVVQSIPALDQAAIECVRQWIFSPAIKNGRPVASLASAPITFTIH